MGNGPRERALVAVPDDPRTPMVLVEYGRDASDRWPVEEVGIMELTAVEVAEMNRRLVWTPCRVLPAKWFPEMTAEAAPACRRCGR